MKRTVQKFAQQNQKNFKIGPQSLAHENSVFKDSDSIELPIEKINVLTHDTSIYTLGLGKGKCIGTYPGAHIKLVKEINGDLIGRWFTPITLPHVTDHTDILIKFYRPTNILPGGKITTYLDTLKVGDKIRCDRPKAKCLYLGNGKFYWTMMGIEQQFNRFAFVCGGSGITPIYQIIQQSLYNNEKIPIDVLFGNRSYHDILLEKELFEIQQKHSHIKIHFALDNMTLEQQKSGKYLLGQISPEMMDKVLPKGEKGVFGFACGPKPMNLVAINYFEKMGYPEDHIWKQ